MDDTSITNTDDNIQHGLDDDPNNDAEKGAALGGVGGAATGAVAGAALGPAGAVVGAVVGGVAGAAGSGVAVAAVDKVDNDDTITGIGEGTTEDLNKRNDS
jgi:phage tail tape-measure protein